MLMRATPTDLHIATLEETLSDGSVVYNVVISTGPRDGIVLHTCSEVDASELLTVIVNAIDAHTVDRVKVS